MEQLIIVGAPDKKKKTTLLLVAILAIVVAAMLFGLTYLLYISDSNWYEGTSYSNVKLYGETYRIPYTYRRCYNDYHEFFTFYLADALVTASIVSWVLFGAMSRCALTLTDMRLSGKTNFGKVVSVPVDMIHSVSISKGFSTVSVATGSGVKKFHMMANYQDIYMAIGHVLNSRQRMQYAPMGVPMGVPMGAPMPGAPMPGAPMPGAPMPGAPMPGAPMPGAPMPGAPMPGAPMPGAPMPGAPMPGAPMPAAPMGAPVPPAPVADDTEELIRFKTLLDQGIITQEEFDAKKKQVLGL